MSSSTKKKRGEPVECCNCSGTVLAKDVSRHRDQCRPDAPFAVEQWPTSTHGLLHSHCFVAAVVRGDGASCASAEGWARRREARICPAAMQTLGAAALSAVLVVAPGADRPTICVARPDDAVPLTSVALTQSPSSDVVLLLVARHVAECARLVLTVGDDCRFAGFPEFRQFLGHYFCGAVLRCGDSEEVRYFGQRCALKVCEIVPDEMPDVSALTLTDRADCPTADRSLTRLTAAPLGRVSERTVIELATAAEPSAPLSHVGQVALEEIGGLDKVKLQLADYLRVVRSGTVGLVSVLLYGASGCGKSLLLTAISGSADCHVIAVLAAQSAEEREESVKAAMAAAELKPVLLTYDDVDAACAGDRQPAVVAAAHLCRFLDACEHSSVLALVTAKSPDRLDASLRRRFVVELEVPVPGRVERLQILRVCSRRFNLDDDAVISATADAAHGYSGSDLAAVCKQAAMARSLDNALSGEEAMRAALRLVRPSAMREIVLEVPHVRWSDVGGQDELKLKLQQAVEWPLRHPQAFERLGVTPPSGVLLYGPPGCSKTLIARALATESGLNFLAVKGPELFSKWVGESERAVRELFRRARQAAPAIVFFDEIDALAVARGGGASGGAVGDRVLAQLLTELDGVEPLGGVTCVAATNRPDVLDAALLRPGRLDHLLYVPLPDESTRAAIVDLQLKRVPADASVDRQPLVEATRGYSGAEIVGVCREAAYVAMRENLNSVTVTQDHFDAALAAIKPLTDEAAITTYERFQLKKSAKCSKVNVD